MTTRRGRMGRRTLRLRGRSSVSQPRHLAIVTVKPAKPATGRREKSKRAKR